MSRDGNLRTLFRLHLKGFHFQSIESHSTGRGTPDSNYCKDGVEGWVEFKATDSQRAKVRPEQVGWIETRVRHGGLVFVAVRQVRDDTLWLFPGAGVRLLLTHPLGEAMALAFWPGGPKAWDWGQIGLVLARK